MNAQDFAAHWLASWTGGSAAVEGLLAFYAPDARYSDPRHPAGLVGHDALRAYFHKLLGRYPDWKWQVVEVAPTSAGFALKWQATLGAKTCFGLDLVELRGSLISRNEVYFDPAALF